MAWRRPGDKPLSEQRMGNLLTHICVTRPQWVNIKLFAVSYRNSLCFILIFHWITCNNLAKRKGKIMDKFYIFNSNHTKYIPATGTQSIHMGYISSELVINLNALSRTALTHQAICVHAGKYKIRCIGSLVNVSTLPDNKTKIRMKSY